jgi:hypothetical protein
MDFVQVRRICTVFRSSQEIWDERDRGGRAGTLEPSLTVGLLPNPSALVDLLLPQQSRSDWRWRKYGAVACQGGLVSNL